MRVRAHALIWAAGLVLLTVLNGCPQPQDQVRVVSRSASGNILVQDPEPDEEIGNPVTVTGKARVFEAALVAGVRDQNGKQLGIAYVMASQGAPEFGDFSAKVSYTRPPGVSRGAVVVYSASPKDGSPINVVTIPIRFVIGD